MRRRVRGMGAALAAGALVIGLAACGSSGSEGAEAPDDASTSTSTVDDATTAPTVEASTTTAPAELDGLPSCQELLQQYADTFTMDDLAPTAALFRQWAPFMPDDVAEASIALAEAYEQAGDGTGLDMTSVDLTADAQTFSDWTNEGCPAG